MQKRMLAVVLALILLCGCGGQEKEVSNKDNSISLQVPDAAVEDEKEIPKVTVTEYPMPEEVARLEKLDFTNMGLYADEAQSMRNSNQLSAGYFSADGEGNIYFTDFTNAAICVCGQEGEDKEILYAGSGAYLQYTNGYLYFGGIEPKDKYIDSFVRIDCNTKEAEVLYEKPCGEVMVLRDVMYLIEPGLSAMKLDEPDSEIVGLSEIEYAFLNTDGRYLLYNMVITEKPRFLFERGYVLAWDTETETNYFVESGMVFPLLAGNWLSYYDVRTNTRHVLDLKTGTDTDLEYSIQRPVSDGHKLYWCVQEEVGSFQIFQWDGKEIQELCTVEVESEKIGDIRLFLAEGYLYWMFEAKLREEAEWGYYRLADGKAGRLN
ncbi:MAG: DUF5050 domain-containing protein [Lachnospiraceae bacterium]|nr:DUF5050 domain-containing protein [Lachnospiraceae bacterium]